MKQLVSQWLAMARPFASEGQLEALAAIPDALGEPARIVVVGLVGVGKTTLVNRWCGTDHATGLGGVTREATTVEGTRCTCIDTPGIDRPEEALLWLPPLLADADALVWVVDGLQPLMERERRVVHETCPDALPVVALVARGDLLDDQKDDVLARVTSHLAPRLSAGAVALDLRHDPLPEPMVSPTPKALGALRHMVEGFMGSLGPAPPSAQEAGRQARERVRALVEQLIVELHQGRLAQKVDGRLALRGRGPSVLQGLLPEPVPLPVPAMVPHGPRARALGSMSGLEGAERLVRADAAGWLADVQLAILEAYETHPEWDESATRREGLQDAADALLAALHDAMARAPRPGHRPPSPGVDPG